VLKRSRASLHAFRLTDNDVHLVIEISDIPVGRIVQEISSHHARFVNRRQGRTGQLFRQQHRAVLLERDADFLQGVLFT